MLPRIRTLYHAWHIPALVLPVLGRANYRYAGRRGLIVPNGISRTTLLSDARVKLYASVLSDLRDEISIVTIDGNDRALMFLGDASMNVLSLPYVPETANGFTSYLEGGHV